MKPSLSVVIPVLNEAENIGKAVEAVLRAINDSNINQYEIIISANFGRLMRLFFGVKLKYFTGPAIIRTDLFRAARRSTYGFAFMAEILVQIIKAGYSYYQVPMPLQPRTYGEPGVYRLKDMWRVFKAVFSMFFNVHFSGAVSNLRNLKKK